jgi:hypothetical protein
LVAGNAIGEDLLTKVDRIFVIDSIPLSVTISTNPATICVNDTFSLVSTPNTNGKSANLSYTWKKNGISISNTQANVYGLTPNTLDKYQLFVQSSTRCVTPNPAQSVIISPKTKGVKTISVSCNLDTLKASPSGTGTFTWYKNGIVVGTGQKFKASQIGLYRCVYNENGCQSDSSAMIILKSVGNAVVANSLLHIFPNPTFENDITIQIPNITSENCELRITDLVGKEVLNYSNHTIKQSLGNIKVERNKFYTSGLYIAQLIINHKVVQTQKIEVN